ncbi:hypothetical protein V6N12_031513 [Hibiscus sabdariffa]|uniref:Uncharacterized protein n=1 Tax=Hibiscus sabdariffa TaxID=183260 RepID=A0ABR2CPG7_9ROSI
MVPAIQSVPALERPTSPTLVQEQPVSKKNKTATIDGDVVQEMVMDTTDDVLPSHMRNMAFHGEHGTGNAGDANTDLGKNESYASMAAKSRGTIWGSRFAALEVSDDNGLPGSTGEIAHSVTRTMEADVHSGESRQAPPRMVMHKNSAYVASNPEKKSRNGRKMTSSPAVLPIVEGQEATVVSWKAQGQGGILGVHGSGLKAKRALEVRRGASTSVSGFIDSVVGELDKIAEDTGLEVNTKH